MDFYPQLPSLTYVVVLLLFGKPPLPLLVNVVYERSLNQNSKATHTHSAWQALEK